MITEVSLFILLLIISFIEVGFLTYKYEIGYPLKFSANFWALSCYNIKVFSNDLNASYPGIKTWIALILPVFLFLFLFFLSCVLDDLPRVGWEELQLY